MDHGHRDQVRVVGPQLPLSIPDFSQTTILALAVLPSCAVFFFFFFGGGVAWVMQITSVFTIHLALAGAAYSSSGVCLPPIEVRDRPLPHHPTNNDPKPKITNKFKSNVLQD